MMGRLDAMQATGYMIANHELAEVLAMVNNTRLDATATSLTSAPWRIAKLEGLDATAAGMIGAMHGTGRSSGAIGNRLAGIRPHVPPERKAARLFTPQPQDFSKIRGYA